MEQLDKVLIDLKDKKTNNVELSEMEQKNYGELVQSFSKSVKSKLSELKEGDITAELKSQIEMKLTTLGTGLEALTLEQTITKIEEIKEILDMEIEVASNTSVKNIEQLLSGSAFGTELTELSQTIQTENTSIHPESKTSPKQEQNTTSLFTSGSQNEVKTSPSNEKQDQNVSTLFNPAQANKQASEKSVLSNNEYLKVEVGSKTKKVAEKVWDGTKDVASKVGNALRSPFGLLAGAGIGIASIFSKKFRRGVGKVVGAPFKAVGGIFRGIGNTIAAPFGWIGAKLNGQKYDFKQGAYDSEDQLDKVEYKAGGASYGAGSTIDTDGDGKDDFVVADTNGDGKKEAIPVADTSPQQDSPDAKKDEQENPDQQDQQSDAGDNKEEDKTKQQSTTD